MNNIKKYIIFLFIFQTYFLFSSSFEYLNCKSETKPLHFQTSDNENMILIIVGESKVGKSTIAKRFSGRDLSRYYSETICLDLLSVKTKDKDGKSIDISIYDHSGNNDLYQSINRSYYQYANVFFIVIDVTKEEALKVPLLYLEEIRVRNKKEDLQIYIVANKIDLNTKRKISKKKIRLFSEKNNLFYEEISALSLINTNYLLNKMVLNFFKRGKSLRSHLKLRKRYKRDLSRSKTCSSCDIL